jgi:hypothetical protein
MKKTLALTAAMVLAGQLVNAQTQKGTQNLGVYLSYSNFDDKTVSTPTSSSPSMQKSSSNNFTIGPSYGYFIANGTELAANAYVSGGGQTNESEYSATTSTFKQKSTNFGVTLFLRKYFLYDNKFGFRVGPYAGYSYGKTKYESTPPNSNNNTSSNTNGYSAGGMLDLVYYPSNKLGISANLANLSYSHSKSKGVDVSTSNNFTARFANSGLALTVFYVIGAN